MPKLIAANKQLVVQRYLCNRFGHDIKIAILKHGKAYLAFRTKDEIHLVYVNTRTSIKDFPTPPSRTQAEKDLDKTFNNCPDLFKDNATIKFDHICLASKEDQNGVLIRAQFSFLDFSQEEEVEADTERFD